MAAVRHKRRVTAAANKVHPPMSLLSRRLCWLPVLALPRLAFAQPLDIDLSSPTFWLSLFVALGALAMGLVLGLVRRQRQRLRLRRTELERERSERSRLAALLNAIPDGVYFKDAAGAYEA